MSSVHTKLIIYHTDSKTLQERGQGYEGGIGTPESQGSTIHYRERGYHVCMYMFPALVI